MENNLRALIFIRLSLGLVYMWFGVLKFFPGMSPAEQLAMDTLERLTFHQISGHAGLLLLAIWETGMGLGLLIGRGLKSICFLLFVHLGCTFSPLFLFPNQSFQHFPYSFTLIGQYIVKNLVYLGVVWLLWGQTKALKG